MTEKEVILECQKWKIEHFWELYEKYVDEIYKFVYLKTYDNDLTQDIVSDTFFKALNKINTFKIDDNANFRAWIYRISYNLIIDNSKNKDINTSIDEFFEFWYENDLAKDLDNKEKLKKVLDYFDTLNPKHKEILVMRFWDDLSFKEISQITWQSLDNCKKIVSRSLKNLPREQFLLLIILLLNI